MTAAFSPRLLGLLCVFLSAAGFGAMPIFARYAYAEGIDVPTLLFLRFSLAGALMSAVVFWRRIHLPRGRNLLTLMAMGGLGYSVQAACYFGALHYATAGLTALLLYLYPVIVTLLSALLARRALAPLRALAVFAALGGTALAVGDSLSGSPLGIVLGVGAALLYSVYILVGERVMAEEDALASGTVVLLSGALAYALWLLAGDGPRLPVSAGGWMAVLSIALFSTVLGIVGFLVGMQRLGAADAATFSTLEPVVTIVLAALFLGEGIGITQALGGAIILGAVIALVRSSKKSH